MEVIFIETVKWSDRPELFDLEFEIVQNGIFCLSHVDKNVSSNTLIYRDIVPDKPLYANAVNGTVLEGSVQNLVDSILRGEDFRLTIGNGLRIPAANIEFQGEGNDTLVTEMGIFESSRQVVDSGGIDIYEFLANVSRVVVF